NPSKLRISSCFEKFSRDRIKLCFRGPKRFRVYPKVEFSIRCVFMLCGKFQEIVRGAAMLDDSGNFRVVVLVETGPGYVPIGDFTRQSLLHADTGGAAD